MAIVQNWRLLGECAMGAVLLVSGCSLPGGREESPANVPPMIGAAEPSNSTESGVPKRRQKIRFATEVANSRKEFLYARRQSTEAAKAAAATNAVASHTEPSITTPIPPGPPYPHTSPNIVTTYFPPTRTERLPDIRQASHEETLAQQ